MIEMMWSKESGSNWMNQEGVKDIKKAARAIITSPKMASTIILIRDEILIRPKTMEINSKVTRDIGKSTEIRLIHDSIRSILPP
jgi:hypothetical protein